MVLSFFLLCGSSVEKELLYEQQSVLINVRVVVLSRGVISVVCRLNCIQTDHKAVMAKIEKSLHALHEVRNLYVIYDAKVDNKQVSLPSAVICLSSSLRRKYWYLFSATVVLVGPRKRFVSGPKNYCECFLPSLQLHHKSTLIHAESRSKHHKFAEDIARDQPLSAMVISKATMFRASISTLVQSSFSLACASRRSTPVTKNE